MTDDRRNREASGAPGAWQPTAPGEYEADATAFVELPEGVTDDYEGYGTDASPLAAPGHYVPPPIAVNPAEGAPDPAGTGGWGAPGALAPGMPQQGLPDASQGPAGPYPGMQSAEPGAVHWPDPNIPSPQDARQHPGEPGMEQHPQGPYGYDPQMTSGLPENGREPAPGAGSPAGTGTDGTGGPWQYDDGSQGPVDTGEVYGGQPGAAPAGPSAVPGEWDIPLTPGDLPDETGEFTSSMLAAQWGGGVPPTTLPGGATAPWAAGAGTGQPWDGTETQQGASPQPPEDRPSEARRMQQGVQVQRAGHVEEGYRQPFPEPGPGQHPGAPAGGPQLAERPPDHTQPAPDHAPGGPEYLQDQRQHDRQRQEEQLHGQQFPGGDFQGGLLQDGGIQDPQSSAAVAQPQHEMPGQPSVHPPYPQEGDFVPGGQATGVAGDTAGHPESAAGYAAPGAVPADPGTVTGHDPAGFPGPADPGGQDGLRGGFQGTGDGAGQGRYPGGREPFPGTSASGQDLGTEELPPDVEGTGDDLYVHPAVPGAALLPDTGPHPEHTAPATSPEPPSFDGTPRTSKPRRPARRPLQDTRVQEPLPDELTGEGPPQEPAQDPAAPGPSHQPGRPLQADGTPADQAAPGQEAAAPVLPGAADGFAGEAFPHSGHLDPDAEEAGAEPVTADATPEGATAPPAAAVPSQEAPHSAAPPLDQGADFDPGTPEPGTQDPSGDHPHLPQGGLREHQVPQDHDDPHGPREPQALQGVHDPAASEDTAPDDSHALHDEHPLGSYVLRVNGTDRPVTGAWIGESLLYVLRERLGLAGAKDGCSQGECGACNVQVDGRLVASCLVPAVTTAGSEVRTVEGLAEDGRPSDVQRALARCGAVQCGFCVPGMAMTVHDLLEGNPAPTDLEARQALAGNLCRCSGYRGVLDAVRSVAAQRRAAAAQASDSATAGRGAQTAEPGQDTDAQGPRIPHQTGPGGRETTPSGPPTPYAAHTAQDAPYHSPHGTAAPYEDDGYDDGGRA